MSRDRSVERRFEGVKTKFKRFLRRKGRKFCATALCVTMLFTNAATSIGSTGDDETAEFNVTSESLKEALKSAVETGKTVDNTYEFKGEDAEAYEELFEVDGCLYKLNPEIEDNSSKLSLSVYARVYEELVDEDGYEITGTEDIIFLLKNDAKKAQKAVIRVDDMASKVITVAPKSSIQVDGEGPSGDDESSISSGDGGLTAGNSAASSDGTGIDKESSAAEETVEEKTDETEGNISSDNGIENPETNAPEIEADDAGNSESKEEIGNIENSEAGKESEDAGVTAPDDSENADSEKESADGGSKNDSGNSSASGSASDSGNSSASGSASDSGNSSASGSGSDTGSSSDSGSNSDSGSSSDSGSDNDFSSSETASVSSHYAVRVMAAAATPSEIVAEKETEVTIVRKPEASVWEAEESVSEATPSEATPSEATPSEATTPLNGDYYNTVLLGNNAVAAFVVNAGELALDDTLFEAELDYVLVRVSADRGVLPRGAELSVTELTESGDTADKYQEAKDALDKAEAEYSGMMALDISFLDEDGNEVEPEDGGVRVTIEMKPEVLPEHIDIDTVTVQHLKELENGEIQVEKVADTTNETDGTIKKKDDVANESLNMMAEFEVESFSSFVITWKDGKEVFKVTAEIVNSNGDPISSPADVELNMGETFEVNGKVTVDGLKCTGVYYGTKDGKEITTITSEKKEENFLWLSWKNYSLNFKNGDTVVATLDANDDSTVQTATIYYVFESETVVEPSEPIREKELTRVKTATINNDGTYDINLTISGAVGKSTVTPKLDILLIVDSSGSMSDTVRINNQTKSRMEWTQEAVKSLTDLMDKKVQSSDVDVRYSYVDFDTTANGRNRIVSWTDNANVINDKINSVDYSSNNGGGTNYQAAIEAGKTLLTSARTDAQTYVIFLTDGNPTFRNYVASSNHSDCSNWLGNYHDQGVCGSGTSDTYGYNLNAAVESIKGMSCTAFYAVGFGTGVAESNLKKLCDNAGTATGAYVGKAEPYTTSDDILSVFNSISADITSVLCDHVSVTDTLSENVEPVLDASGTPKKIVVSIKNTTTGAVSGGTSNTVAAPQTEQNAGEDSSRTITAEYDSDNKQIKLNFPLDYKLEADLEYTVSMTVDATQKAYDNYAAANGYPNAADAETGTHEEREGLYSNDTATVTYTYNGDNKTEAFAKPVVRISPGVLTITKTFEGLERMDEESQKALLENLKFDVTLSYKDDTGDKVSSTRSISLKDMTTIDGTTFTYEFKSLHPDTEFSVKESGETVTGYDLTKTVAGTVNGVEATVSEDGTVQGIISIQDKTQWKGGEAQVNYNNRYKIHIVPPTGIFTDTMPYLWLLIFALSTITVFGFFAYRRRENSLR